VGAEEVSREALEAAYRELKEHDADYHHRTPAAVLSLIADALAHPRDMSPERTQRAHDLAEEIRELVRLGVQPEHRPEGLFQKCQDLVYLFRGRT
jgi:hypothetical protein